MASILISQSGPTNDDTPTSVLAGGCSGDTYLLRTSRMIGLEINDEDACLHHIIEARSGG